MAHDSGNALALGVFSRLTRRQFVRNAALGAATLTAGSIPRAARAADDINFWATGTLDIGDDGWKIVANDTGVRVNFTDNGNDPGPVVARLAAGNANDIYDMGGLQGGSEKELARRGLIAPWDLSQIPNYASLWQWAKDIPYLAHEGKIYGIPAVINADSIIALRDKAASVDSYGVIFDPKLKGKTAMEDAWINSVIFTAMYLKNSENAKIAEPGNLTARRARPRHGIPDQAQARRSVPYVLERLGTGSPLVANREVWVMTGWEPIVYAARARGVDCYYAAPKEGYEAWGNNAILLKGALIADARRRPHQLVNALLSGFYGCKLGILRGYVVPTDNNVAYATANSTLSIRRRSEIWAEHVKQKFAGKIYWQNTRPDNFQLYETWWQRLRNA